MKPVQTALLFVVTPTLALMAFRENLNRKLKFTGIEMETAQDDDGQVVCTGGGYRLDVVAMARPLPAEDFHGSLESLLSSPFRGALSEVLFRHSRHMAVTVTHTGPTAEADLLTALRIAHAATTLLAEWHMPSAVFWRQSNQLLLGGHYLRLAGDDTPWVLFTHARTVPADPDDGDRATAELHLDNASSFVGRPVVFLPSSLPTDVMHAATLAFVRHAVNSGQPISDGNSFGPSGGVTIKVRHAAPGPDLPLGRFELELVKGLSDREKSDWHDRQPPRRLPAASWQGDRTGPAADALAPTVQERERSRAISLVMLLVMPPIGLLVLVLNQVLGPNAWRSGVVAVSSVALALVVAAYTYLNYVGNQTVVFIDRSPVITSVLPD